MARLAAPRSDRHPLAPRYLAEVSGRHERRFTNLRRAREWARTWLDVRSFGSWAEIYRDDRGVARLVEALRHDVDGVRLDGRSSRVRRGALGPRPRSTADWVRVPLDTGAASQPSRRQRARRDLSGATRAPKKGRVRRDRPMLSGVALDRATMDEELYEFAEDFSVSPLHVTTPGYLTTIARDAGVDLSDLRGMMKRLQALEKEGRGGSSEADRAAGQIGAFVKELREQVLNASIDQVRRYAAARSRWIRS